MNAVGIQQAKEWPLIYKMDWVDFDGMTVPEERNTFRV